jgi:alpha-tubulin suppressor-like RCC1 family protein
MSSSTITTAILGQVVVWGDDTAHQITDAPKAAQFRKVAPGGGKQALALHSNGKLTLWGGVPPPPLPMKNVPALTLTAGEKYIDLAIGVSFAAAIRDSDHCIQTWGELAEPVNGSQDSSLPPEDAGMRFVAVTVAGGHGVAIEEHTRTLYQWGAGHGTQPQPRGVKFVEVRARNNYSIALDEFGGLYGWGGVLFAPPTPAGSVPVTLQTDLLQDEDWQFVAAGGYYFHKGPFTAIAAGGVQKTLTPQYGHVLAIKRSDSSVVGWGRNTFQAITGAPKGVRFTAVAAGAAFSIGLDDKGELWHWGNRGVLQPTGKGSLETVPKGPFVSIGAGTLHASAVRPSSPYASSFEG